MSAGVKLVNIFRRYLTEGKHSQPVNSTTEGEADNGDLLPEAIAEVMKSIDLVPEPEPIGTVRDVPETKTVAPENLTPHEQLARAYRAVFKEIEGRRDYENGRIEELKRKKIRKINQTYYGGNCAYRTSQMQAVMHVAYESEIRAVQDLLGRFSARTRDSIEIDMQRLDEAFKLHSQTEITDEELSMTLLTMNMIPLMSSNYLDDFIIRQYLGD